MTCNEKKLNLESIHEEIKKHHPKLKFTDECIKGLVEILKKQCPHLNPTTDTKKSDNENCECNPCECDPCEC